MAKMNKELTGFLSITFSAILRVGKGSYRLCCLVYFYKNGVVLAFIFVRGRDFVMAYVTGKFVLLGRLSPQVFSFFFLPANG